MLFSSFFCSLDKAARGKYQNIDIQSRGSLISEDHSGGKDDVCVQIENISAFSTTEILQIFTLVTDQSDLTCRGPSVQASITIEADSMRLFLTNDTLRSLPLSWQWIELLAKHMEINDSISRNLLFAALTDPISDRVYKQFESHGYHVDYTPSAMSSKLVVIEMKRNITKTL